MMKVWFTLFATPYVRASKTIRRRAKVCTQHIKDDDGERTRTTQCTSTYNVMYNTLRTVMPVILYVITYIMIIYNI